MFATHFAALFVGAFAVFAAMRLRLENQQAAHQAALDAMRAQGSSSDAIDTEDRQRGGPHA